MADTKISNLTELTTPIGGDLLPIVDDPTGTPITKYTKGHRLVEMGERNYKFVVTIASNNITVALKNLAGNDFSATDPLVVKIGNAWRIVTAALSVTVNAGASTFAAGATMFAAKNIDYFVYLGYRTASTAVVLGFSRIPWANLYSDFSGTSTNEKYGVFSTTPAATDEVINIGRFRAQNSGTASFNWSSVSQSAPNNENTIQKPWFKTADVWLTASPTVTATAGSFTTVSAAMRYQIDGRKLFFNVIVTITTNGTAATATDVPLPFSARAANEGEFVGRENASTGALLIGWLGTLTSLRFQKFDGTYMGADGYAPAIHGFCELG